MARGLSVSGVVNVSVNISPLAAGQRNFGVALLMGSSDVIDVSERVRAYRTLDEVASEFGTTASEFLAAELYFSQSPQPNLVYIGRWAQAAAPAILHGGVLLPTEQDIAVWNAVTNGGMTIVIGGVTKNLTALDFSGATNLNGVAAIIDAALSGGSVTWDGIYERFDIRSDATGSSASVGYATAPGSGTNIAPMLRMTSGTASVPVAGVGVETPLAAAQAAADRSGDWYGISFVTSVQPTDNQLVDVSAYIEGASRARMHAVTTQNTQVLDPLIANDIASRLKALRYKRSTAQYCSGNPYAVVSMLARAYTVNFEATDTTITLKFKQEPGVAAEDLTETQALTLRAKNCNVFVNYDNDTAILQEGVMSNGYFFDEVHGLDWQANAVQTEVWNLLYQTPTKIPQTNSGIAQICAVVENALTRGVNNGLIAGGQWNGPNMGGLLRTGQALNKGFLVFAGLVEKQPQADRERRKAPPIQAAIKLAGAVHSADVIMNVNR
jgi:hypothetical protein